MKMRKEQIITKVACLGCFASAAAVILLLDNLVLSLVLICLSGLCANICRNNMEQAASGWIIVLRETLLLFGAVVAVQVVAFAIELSFVGKDAELIVGATMALWVIGTVISGTQIDRALTRTFSRTPRHQKTADGSKIPRGG